METPIVDFLRRYCAAGTTRFHMPGHKGVSFLGCEEMDITEVQGADALYEADGIIAQSEEHAAGLFHSRRTCYSTEGSSQCIRAMLYLALGACPAGTPRVIVAARNVHKAFVYAAALLDFQVVWLWPEGESQSICGCPVTPAGLERTLSQLDVPPAAVYLTSPDYLGGMADVAALAQVAHRHQTLLLVDNAHGAYLHFLSPSLHPLDLGADLCCDSAHKTLPVLTGGAYLHVGRGAPPHLTGQMKAALALFGSTSPSYLTLASLDGCNRYLTEAYPAHLEQTVQVLRRVRVQLARQGWQVQESDPLRLTVKTPETLPGTELAQRLRRRNIESEYTDRDFLVLMVTPENTPEDLTRLTEAMGDAPAGRSRTAALPLAKAAQAVSIRQALFSPQETVPADLALGRICGAPTVACPPAIPIAVSGERIGKQALELFADYGVTHVSVLK